MGVGGGGGRKTTNIRETVEREDWNRRNKISGVRMFF